jgi:hypothetical protein
VRNISSSLLITQINKIMSINNTVDNRANYSREPYHYLQWQQTGGRHYPSYYNRLKKSLACACFGGFFLPFWAKNSGSLINRYSQTLMGKMMLKSNTIVQWDSWRLWESLVAGCTTFHLDFTKYGVSLPVMPENWRHYIGIDLDNVQAAVDRIADEPEILEKIAKEGREWAIANYSPVPTALRFLETIYQQPISQKNQVETLLNV